MLIRILALAAVIAVAAPAAAQAATPRYLVSLGDSYASGFQSTGRGKGHNTRNGFAYKLIADLIAAALPRRHRHH